MHQRRTTTKIKQPCRIGMNGTGGNHDVALHKNNNDNPASCTTNGNDGSSIVSTTTLGTTTATTNTTTISYGNSISTSTNCNNNNVSSNSNRRKRVKRGRRIQSLATNFEFSIHRLLLPLIIIFCILWIRMFYMIGSSRRSLVLPPPVLLSNNTNNENHDDAIQAQNNNNNHDRRRQQQEEARSILISQSESKIDSSSSSSKFQLISNQAPSCNNTVSSEEEIDITLVTQLSQDRLWMMKYHCERYGPNSISIVVYTNQTLEEVRTELVDLGCRVQQATTDDDDAGGNSHGNDNESKSKSKDDDDDDDDEKNMEIDDNDPTAGKKTAEEGAATTTTAAIVSVVVLNAESHAGNTAWNDYPVNELRNLALRAVRTTHILYIDIDFWTSANLYDTLVHNPQIKQQLYQDPKLVLVIPAFQLQRISNCTDETKDCRQEHVPLMPHTFQGLSEGIQNKRITIFDPTNRGGHGSTDYTKWFQQPSGNLSPITCLKSHRYEPFVVIRYCREITPPFQSIFSGYGKNKMTWMMQVIRSGFVFSQLGGVYVIHYPHPLSSSRMNWNTSPKQLQQQQSQQQSQQPHQNYNVRRPKQSDGDTINFTNYKRGQTDLLYLEFKKWLEETIPSTNIRVPMCYTAQDDDNKLWIDPKLKKWK